MILLFRSLLILGLIPWLVHSLASTDSVSDADPSQSGYLPNHNMDPSIVDSPIFGILWQDTFLAKEKWYAKPLVYTLSGGKQMVFIASEQNWIRTLDAVTGAVINQRQVQPPFLQSDIGCTDIPDYIGITGTPVIDPATDTVYFFSKGYNNAGASGVQNGIYKYEAPNARYLWVVS
jgi:iron transport multicopper oxidase